MVAIFSVKNKEIGNWEGREGGGELRSSLYYTTSFNFSALFGTEKREFKMPSSPLLLL